GQPPANIKPPPGLGGSEIEQMERIRRRQRLFYNVEDEFSRSVLPHLKTDKEREAAGSAAQAHQTIYKKAFDLTVSPLRTIFEVNRESARTIQDYCGMQRNNLGLGCLLARRLDETGVTCVEVDLCGLDIHTVIFN